MFVLGHVVVGGEREVFVLGLIVVLRMERCLC